MDPEFTASHINSVQMNNSTSKSRYTFTKEQRFVPVKSSSPPNHYEQKGTFGLSTKKGPTMGIGNRFNKKSFLVPGSYDLPGPFIK